MRIHHLLLPVDARSDPPYGLELGLLFHGKESITQMIWLASSSEPQSKTDPTKDTKKIRSLFHDFRGRYGGFYP